MSIIIKTPVNLKEVKREWLAHQLKKNPHFHSRREFLGQSAAGVTALTFMPTIFSLMTKTHSAQAAVGFNARAVVLNCPGGLTITSEVVPQTVNGAFLTAGSYSTSGMPGQNLTTGVSTKYGAPMWTASLFFQGLEQINAQIESLGGKIYVAAGFHSNSQDDSTNNPIGVAPHIVSAAMQAGAKFRVAGTQLNSNNANGGRAQPSVDFPGVRPAVATTLAQAQDLLSVKKSALAAMSTDALVAGASLAEKLTQGATQRFQAMTGGRQLAELTRAANADLKTNVANENPLDPRTSTVLQSAYGITPSTAVTDPRVAMAASLQFLLNGISPVMVAQLQANFDYHDGTDGWANPTTGQHALVFNTLKPMLLAAAQSRVSLGVYVQTDGASSMARDQKRSIGDANQIHGALYIYLCMNNEQAPSRFQLGGFRSNDNAGGSADTDTNVNILQRNPANEAHAFMASLLGMQNYKVADYAPPNTSRDVFEQLNIFNR
ncbi:MAG: hypothetical protein FJ116_08320 [Deltaproteobacteria bacterium]|nr:hypothetical protein [Deltaproteobacteria bacterium]